MAAGKAGIRLKFDQPKFLVDGNDTVQLEFVAQLIWSLRPPIRRPCA